MASIASPRPSISIRSPSSTRSSFESSAPQSSATSRTAPRRNRAALRDYYGLKSNSAAPSIDTTTTATTASQPSDTVPLSPLDAPSFNPTDHIQSLLTTASLPTILRTEASLIAEIRGLDAERKALVYDNYSKLIAATETIRRMRDNMDPLAPITAKLEGEVDGIVEGVRGLGRGRQRTTADNGRGNAADEESEERRRKERERETVRWVLGASERMQVLLYQGKREEAKGEMDIVRGLLAKWAGVEGAEEVRRECENVLGLEESEGPEETHQTHDP